MDESTASLSERLRCQWKLKLGLAVLLAAVYCSGYLLIERHLWREPIRFRLCSIDQSIGFSIRWVWIYQSIYLLVLLPFLATARDDIRRYGIGFAFMMGVAFGCFILFPVRGPRIPMDHAGGMYGLLIDVDLPYNTFPSMHMAVATYSAWVVFRVMPGTVSRVLKIMFPVWIMLIGYSAMAIKQHYFVDLPAGVLLGWIAQRMAWWRPWVRPGEDPCPPDELVKTSSGHEENC